MIYTEQHTQIQDALKKFIMMVDALEKLRVNCENRAYKDVANLISAFNELSNHFKKYEQIPQIQDLYKEKNSIVTELLLQISEDFETFERGTSILKTEDMLHACYVVEVLGDKAHRKFIETFCQMILNPYQEMFAQSENALLEYT